MQNFPTLNLKPPDILSRWFFFWVQNKFRYPKLMVFPTLALMTMRLPEFKGKTALSNVPTLFWAIIFVALVTGLIFTLVAKFAVTGDSQLRSDYPAYVGALKSSTKDQQVNLRSSLLGSWRATKATTDMIIEFDPKGNFILRVTDKDVPHYILIAHGRYSYLSLDENSGLLLSERRNKPIPLRKPAPYYKFRNLDLFEIAFKWKKQDNQLRMSLLSSPKPQKNFEALIGEYVNENSQVVFEKINRR